MIISAGFILYFKNDDGTIVKYIKITTNLAPYFVDCISEQDLDELNVEIIRNTLYKAYIEDFFNFCKKLGGKTAEVMCEILAVSYFG